MHSSFAAKPRPPSLTTHHHITQNTSKLSYSSTYPAAAAALFFHHRQHIDARLRRHQVCILGQNNTRKTTTTTTTQRTTPHVVCHTSRGALSHLKETASIRKLVIIAHASSNRLVCHTSSHNSSNNIPIQDDLDNNKPKQINKKNSSKNSILIFSIAAVYLTGVSNRVLSKMALTPMANYVFFLSLLQTFGYIAIYGMTLLFRTQAGLVPAAMLHIPQNMMSIFLAIGLVEALSSILTFVSASKLPGIVLPLFSQTVLVWQVFFGYILLRKRLSMTQLTAVGMIIIGVVLASWPSSSSPSILSNIDPMYALIFLVSMMFPSLDTILKERVFRSSKLILGGKNLDLFVVNTTGSIAQAVFVVAMLPAMCAARGISLAELPMHVAMGWQCLQGVTPACGSDCAGAPLLPLLYVTANIAFNIAALNLIRQAGNIVMSLVMSALVPATILAFTLPLPYLDAAPVLGANFLMGSLVLCLGLVVYNSPSWSPIVKEWIARWMVGEEGEEEGSFVG